jgi:hypothetical protein
MAILIGRGIGSSPEHRLTHQKKASELPSFARLAAKPRATKVNSHSQRRVVMSPKPMLTTPCSPFTLGTEIHGELETPQNGWGQLACRACICDKNCLGLQACVGCPPRRSGIALLGAYEPSRADTAQGLECMKLLASLRKTVTWIRFRPTSPDA